MGGSRSTGAGGSIYAGASAGDTTLAAPVQQTSGIFQRKHLFVTPRPRAMDGDGPDTFLGKLARCTYTSHDFCL